MPRVQARCCGPMTARCQAVPGKEWAMKPEPRAITAVLAAAPQGMQSGCLSVPDRAVANRQAAAMLLGAARPLAIVSPGGLRA